MRRIEAELSAFRDESAGDYFGTSEGHEKLFGRTKPIFDQPIPSANAILARCFVRRGKLEEARALLKANVGWIERAPSSTAELALAVLELTDFVGRYPKHPLAARAQLWIGEAYFRQRDYRQALLECAQGLTVLLEQLVEEASTCRVCERPEHGVHSVRGYVTIKSHVKEHQSR